MLPNFYLFFIVRMKSTIVLLFDNYNIFLKHQNQPFQEVTKSTLEVGMPRKIKRRKTGIKRKRKFNPDTRTQIYTALETELPVKRAVKLAGIDYSTYRTWLAKGKNPSYPVHAVFRRRVKKILASIELKKLQTIQKAAEGYLLRDKKIKISKKGKTTIITVREIPIDWKAAAWILERRFPDRYGKKAFQEKSADDSYVLAAQVKMNLDALMDSIPVSP